MPGVGWEWGRSLHCRGAHSACPHTLPQQSGESRWVRGRGTSTCRGAVRGACEAGALGGTEPPLREDGVLPRRHEGCFCVLRRWYRGGMLLHAGCPESSSSPAWSPKHQVGSNPQARPQTKPVKFTLCSPCASPTGHHQLGMEGPWSVSSGVIGVRVGSGVHLPLARQDGQSSFTLD